MKVAIFAKNINEKWFERVCSIFDDLIEKGVKVVCYEPFYCKVIELCSRECACCVPMEGVTTFTGDVGLPGDVDLLLSFGGDGTFLESVSLIVGKNIPVAGINFGRLGFLSCTDSWPHQDWVDKLISGNYITERRSLLKVSGPDIPDDFPKYALNEVSFQRNDPSMIALHVAINGVELPVYWADGVVLATPTGSTAYSLSVGGPIVLPNVKATILAPIAPHNLNVRPLIIPDDFVIEVFVETRGEGAVLSVDNRFLCIAKNRKITISKADYSIEYILFDSNSGNFIAALEDKLMWGKDRRNN